jgi:isocitrate dehydrogenase
MAGIPITVIPGDGIGVDVTSSACAIMQAAKAPVTWDMHEAGEASFKKGIATGVPESTLAAIRRSKAVLKGPLTTPIGVGERSANVFLRKTFGLFANIRPVKQYPGIPSVYSNQPIDLVVIRENIEDLYAGIEYYHQPGIAQSIKLISQYGCDYINAFAFAYACATGRNSLHCATKANILKATEGLMKRSFEHQSAQYPHIVPKHMIIDNCAHQLVMNPSQFEMIVTTNMNGDIISDLTSGLVGGLGIAPSANIGDGVALFEAVHGAAPDIAGCNRANPTAMILSAVMMLHYLGCHKEADAIEHALVTTFSQGQFTQDINPQSGLSTTAFTQAIIANLGKTLPGFKPSRFEPVSVSVTPPPITTGVCKGVDVVIISDQPWSALQALLEPIGRDAGFGALQLSNRGQAIASNHAPLVLSQWYGRFTVPGGSVTNEQILALLAGLSPVVDWVDATKYMDFS